MQKFLSIVIVLCTVGGILAAHPDMQSASRGQQEEEPKFVDLKADLMGPVAPGDTVTFLVGNFAAQHNGAVITCDSAVRYSADHIEFFGNVLINKNTTYIYGDRADYDRLKNEARVYSDIVKVVDGDATLYTYEFAFNTKTNVGIFGGGGVMINRDNLIEADHGFYYADTKELICVDRVEMRNEEYEMKSDSVIYNLETDHAYYFERTNIWNNENDYLYADRGQYVKSDTLYMMTLNGYILTEKQEVWSDSIDYYRAKEHAILRNNVQIDETEHKTLSFGDYGEYWKTPGNALLTRRPAVVNYDPAEADSLFMRADSMFLFTILQGRADPMTPPDSVVTDSLASEVPSAVQERRGSEAQQGDTEVIQPQQRGGRKSGGEFMPADSVAGTDATDIIPTKEADGDAVAETEQPSEQSEVSQSELTPKERQEKLREAARKEKAERKVAAETLREAKLDSIADRRQAKITATLLAQKASDERALEVRKAKAEVRLRARQAKAIRKGRELPDSSMLSRFDSLLSGNALMQDSLAQIQADTLLADSAAIVVPADSLDSLDSIAPIDSMYRLIKAYRNVRTFRIDFQSVCDSLVAVSRDSTIHLYIHPILWNEENQITSDVMDIFTKNQQVVRAEFVGQPMMVSQLDTVYYNQVAGKKMEAFFFNNKIYRNDVNGSAQTIYYIQEDGSPEVQGMMVINSGNISFYIGDDNKVETITYRNDIDWITYPMNKIAPEQEPFLKNFKWEGKRRPTRDDVFDRRIRPSERDARSGLRRPDFPISEHLERDKKYYLERGWADRNDLVTPESEEWMRTLGFTTGQPRK